MRNTSSNGAHEDRYRPFSVLRRTTLTVCFAAISVVGVASACVPHRFTSGHSIVALLNHLISP
jgi:hypothetical protein